MITAMYGDYMSEDAWAALVVIVLGGAIALGGLVAWAAGRPERTKRDRRGGGRRG